MNSLTESYGRVLYLSGFTNVICSNIVDRKVREAVEPESSLEEADDRLFSHINHTVKNSNLSSVLVASSDTDVLIFTVYYF